MPPRHVRGQCVGNDLCTPGHVGRDRRYPHPTFLRRVQHVKKKAHKSAKQSAKSANQNVKQILDINMPNFHSLRPHKAPSQHRASRYSDVAPKVSSKWATILNFSVSVIMFEMSVSINACATSKGSPTQYVPLSNLIPQTTTMTGLNGSNADTTP